jgi:predicted MFS family arabinose efflux permease
MRESAARVYWTAFIGLFFDYYDLYLFVYLDRVLADAFAMSEVQRGWSQFVGLAGVGLGALLFGYLADRFGRRRLLIVVLIAYLVGIAGLSLSWNVGSLFFFRLLASMALGGEWGISHTYMAENIRGKRRYLFSALLQFSILGGLLAWAMKSYAMPVFGWRGLFALSLIPVIVLSLIRFRSLARSGAEARSEGSFVKVLLRSRGAFAACLLLAAFAIASGTVNLFVVKELPQSPVFTVLFWFNVAPGMLIGAALVRRIGVRPAMIVYAALLAGLSVFALRSDWPLRQYAFALALPLINGIPFGLMGAFFNEMFGDYRTALSGAAYNLGRILGGFAPLLVTALALDEEGRYYFFSLGLGLAMLAVSVAMRVENRMEAPAGLAPKGCSNPGDQGSH